MTSTRHGAKSLADWVASKRSDTSAALLEGLSENAIAALPYIFEFWGRSAHQLAPPGDWVTWVILGGRGSGKTRAGTEWVRSMVEGATPLLGGRASNLALVAETWEQAREVMVHGDSGLLACTPPDRRPLFLSTRRLLRWPNGAEAHLFSAADPESLRGPQFDAAWSDELAKWRQAQEAWDMLQFCLRLGTNPQQVVTTTPRDIPLLHALVEEPGTVTTSAPTADNNANLAPAFLSVITKRFEGTAKGREELNGELLHEPEGALFTRAGIERDRVVRAPALDHIVVAIDPPATHGVSADACGIIAAGRAGDNYYVLADRTVAQATPEQWADAALTAVRLYGAGYIVAEVNQGGSMVASTIAQVDPSVPVRSVRAQHGKIARAEPVSLLYAQGRVRHVGHHTALEDQLVTLGQRAKSPDRADALVWAITDLMGRQQAEARVRVL